MNRRTFLGATGAAIGVAPAFVRAAVRAEVQIAVAHDLPKDSTIPSSLKALSRRWQDVLGNVMELYFMPPIPGGESVLLRRLGIRQIQGALLTGSGLGGIDPAARCLEAMPMLASTWAEVDGLQKRVEGHLAKVLHEKGYQVVLWGVGGWRRWFSNRPLTGPADLKGKRFAVEASIPGAAKELEGLGTPIAIPADKIGPALAAGEVEAALVPTARAAALGVPNAAKHLLDLKWAPMVHAFVVVRSTWERVPEDIRRRAENLRDNQEAEIRANLRSEDAAALIRLNDAFGVKVTPVSDAALGQWRTAAADVRSRQRGSTIPPEIFDALTGDATR